MRVLSEPESTRAYISLSSAEVNYKMGMTDVQGTKGNVYFIIDFFGAEVPVIRELYHLDHNPDETGRGQLALESRR